MILKFVLLQCTLLPCVLLQCLASLFNFSRLICNVVLLQYCIVAIWQCVFCSDVIYQCVAESNIALFYYLMFVTYCLVQYCNLYSYIAMCALIFQCVAKSNIASFYYLMFVTCCLVQYCS